MFDYAEFSSEPECTDSGKGGGLEASPYCEEDRGFELEYEFPPGHVFGGQFELVRLLGRGGMALVYEVMDRVTGQHVALKIIRPDRMTHTGARACLIHELTLARQLRHPNIVAVYDIREEGSLLFFTMEYIEGETLHQRLIDRGPFTLEETIRIVRPICAALEHAHKTMVHCDVSLENIMIGPGGVKLLDFGIAKAHAFDPPWENALGKGPHTAPEQRANILSVDSRADIYSLGVIVLELLTKRTLPEPLTHRFPYTGFSRPVEELLERSVAPLERRFRTVAEFRHALDACADVFYAGLEREAGPRREEPSGTPATPHPWQPAIIGRPWWSRMAPAALLFLGSAFYAASLLSGYRTTQAGSMAAGAPTHGIDAHQTMDVLTQGAVNTLGLVRQPTESGWNSRIEPSSSQQQPVGSSPPIAVQRVEVASDPKRDKQTPVSGPVEAVPGPRLAAGSVAAQGTVVAGSVTDSIGPTEDPIHVVAQGETLLQIAARYNARLSDLLAWNELPDARIRVGQRLRLSRPLDGSMAETMQSDSEYHVVEVGESLSRIAAAHRITIAELQQWNALADTAIQAGQKLRVKAP